MIKRFCLVIFILFFSLSSALAKGSINNPLGMLLAAPKTDEPKHNPSQTTNVNPDNSMQAQEAAAEEDEALEFTPFIEKGAAALPVAPGLMESMAKQDVPHSILDESEKIIKPKLAKKDQNIEEKEFEDNINKLFSNQEEAPEATEDSGFLGKLANIFSKKGFEGEIAEGEGFIDINFSKKPGEKIADKDDQIQIEHDIQETLKAEMAKELKEDDTLITKNKDGSLHVITPKKPLEVKDSTAPEAKKEDPKTIVANKKIKDKEPKAPPIQSLAATHKIQKATRSEVILPKPKKVVKIKKKKQIDRKLMSFIRDESIFILFKDDEVVLGNLTRRAKIDQMPFNDYLTLYYKKQKEKAGEKRAKQMEEFIEARSYYATVPLSDSYLKREVKKEIKKSSLTNLKVLEDNYEIIDMVDNDGNTMLHLATYNNNPAIVKWLIMRGAHLDSINFEAISPREIAGFNRNWQIFDMLEKADPK